MFTLMVGIVIYNLYGYFVYVSFFLGDLYKTVYCLILGVRDVALFIISHEHTQ